MINVYLVVKWIPPIFVNADDGSDAPATVRQMALRGGFQTARKIGRNWVIEDSEPYPDHRKINDDE